MLRYILTLSVFVALTSCAFAADISVKIRVFSKETGAKIIGAKVEVYDGRDLILTEHTDQYGGASFSLALGKVYKITADYEGKVGKNVIVDTKTVPADKQEALAKRQVLAADFNLFDQGELRYTHLEHPMGRFKYDKRKKLLVHDKEYTKRRWHSNSILRKKS